MENERNLGPKFSLFSFLLSPEGFSAIISYQPVLKLDSLSNMLFTETENSLVYNFENIV